MRRFARVAALMAVFPGLAGGALAAFQATEAGPFPSIRFTVRVLDEAQGQPVAGARVSLPLLGREKTTGPDGKVVFRLQPASSVDSVYVRAEGPDVPAGFPLASRTFPTGRFLHFEGQALAPLGSEIVSTPQGPVLKKPEGYRVMVETLFLKSPGDWVSPLIDSQGGTFQSADSNFFVNVPAGVFSQPRKVAVTLVPPPAMTLPDDERTPGWSSNVLGQIEVTLLDSADQVLPSESFDPPLLVGVRDPAFHRDLDGNGTFEWLCGFDVEQYPNLLAPLETASLAGGPQLVPEGSTNYDPSTGHLLFLIPHDGGWICRGFLVPPGTPAGPAMGQACDGFVDFQDFTETKEKARAQIHCGNSSGPNHFFWSAGAERTFSLSAQVDVKALAGQLHVGLKAGTTSTFVIQHDGGGEVGRGSFDHCFSAEQVLYVKFNGVALVCIPDDNSDPYEIGRVEVEDSQKTVFEDEANPDPRCPGCGGG